MPIGHLKTSQTNELFKAVEAAGFQPAEFRWGTKSAQIEVVVTRISEARAAAARLGRKGWLMFVMGTLSSAAIGAALAPEAARGLFHSVAAALAWLARQAPMLP